MSATVVNIVQLIGAMITKLNKKGCKDMSEKVKLQKEVIEVIETMTATGAPLNEIVERHIHGDHLRVNGYGLIEQMSTDTLIRALYIGYEVEETPEERLL